MKLSDYVISFLEDKKVKDVFLLSGGGIMHLLDSLAKNDNINKYSKNILIFCYRNPTWNRSTS